MPRSRDAILDSCVESDEPVHVAASWEEWLPLALSQWELEFFNREGAVHDEGSAPVDATPAREGIPAEAVWDVLRSMVEDIRCSGGGLRCMREKG